MRTPREAFGAYYAAMTEGELLHAATNQVSLAPIARAVLGDELHRRGREDLILHIPAQADPVTTSRPRWIWTIAVWYGFSLVFMLLSSVLIYTGLLPLNPTQRQYFANMGIAEYLGSATIGTLNMIGVIQLVKLRRSAVFFFTTAISLSAALALFFVQSGAYNAAGRPGLVGTIIGWALQALVVLYARRLQKQGVLN